jgi:hypothetical protein
MRDVKGRVGNSEIACEKLDALGIRKVERPEDEPRGLKLWLFGRPISCGK